MSESSRWSLWIERSRRLSLLGALLLTSCASIGGDVTYHGEATPDRRDYATFRAAHSELLEPNYLPFMVHQLPGGDDVVGDDLVLCRWSDERMPLRVAIEAPFIPSHLQNEFNPREPEDYVEAVERALDAWEKGMEGLVRFRRVPTSDRADIRVRLLGERAPDLEPGKTVLGVTEGLRGACVSKGWDRGADRLRVKFEVPEFSLYVADSYDLLTPEQARRIAMHELGHALGMRGHSPLSTDLMYSVLGEDRRVDVLSEIDLNSFLSLYRVANGTHYARTRVEGIDEARAEGPPSGPPRLALAPHVNSHHGFKIRVPEGWMGVDTPHGYFAADGPFWDYDASLEIFVWPYPTIEAFIERFGEAFLGDSWIRYRGPMIFHGRRAQRVMLEESDGRSADFTVVELGDGRVMLILSHCPSDRRELWAPWLDASLASLDFWD